MKYLKAAVAVVVSAAGALVTALGTDGANLSNLSTQTWLIAAVAVLGSGGIVWYTQNGPDAPYIKAVVGFLSAGISSLVVGLDDHLLTQAEILTAFIAAVLATGVVFQAKNQP